MSDFDFSPLHSLLNDLAPRGRTALLPALHSTQSIYGYIPEQVALEVSRVLKVPLSDVYGVIDFYAMFYSQPVGKKVIRICNDPPCVFKGGEEVLRAVCHHLEVQPDQMTTDGAFTVERSPCLGLCEHAPAVLVGTTAIGHARASKAAEIVQGVGQMPHGVVGGDLRILTANCGGGQPTSLKTYEERGGYQGLRKTLSMTPQEIISEVKASGLVGRGGAAFPTGVKWEGTYKAAGDIKYIVCNADESEPGTFKDRVLMEEDPQRTLEGMIIAAYVIGAHQGYFYIRGEYPYGYEVISAALEEARQAGYLGQNILGSGFDFDIEMRKGAGAYICGEETALFESIEGKRGFPRVKPPFPTTFGLFGKPTIINNVETFCNIPLIVEKGAASYRQYGTEKSPGPKLFCVSGDVMHPGLYEVPFGITLRHLLEDLAGGVSGGSLQAILLGGAAGAFATEKNLDVKLTFEDLRAQGLPLGSGVVMVLNNQRDLRRVFKGLAHFFADESCGKCYPCQIGTQRQYEILSRVADGELRETDLDSLKDVGWTMVDASLCGLGQTAATAVLSAIELWPEYFSRNGKSHNS